MGGGGGGGGGAAGVATKAGFPKDRVTRMVKKFDEKRNEKRVETGQIGRVTERKMDPIIQYTGRKVGERQLERGGEGCRTLRCFYRIFLERLYHLLMQCVLVLLSSRGLAL